MNQGKVSKDTRLVLIENFKDYSFRLINQKLVKVNKGYENNLFKFY